MKRTLLSVFAGLMISAAALAQGSLKIIDASNNDITNTDIHTWGSNGTDIISDAGVVNISSASKTFKAKRIVNSVPSSSYNYFCWHLCYGPGTSVSPQGLSIPAGDTSHAFHGYYYASGNNGEAIITYVFYDQANTNDSAYVRVHYWASPTGIQDVVTGENKISTAFPNPASAFTNLNYSLKSNVQSGKIVMYNMIGEMVKEIELEDKQGTIKLNAGEMSNGIYFYSLVADNKVISTKKLVISH